MVKENISLEFDKCTLKVRHKTRSSEDLKESELHVEHETIRTGSLYYEKHRIDSRHLPFMLTPYTVDMEKVLNILFHDWHLPDPKVIIFALAEAEYSLSDEYRRLSRKLVKGLVHALNTTEMWLCTDGLNHGFSRDVGKAFEDEMSKREMVESSKYSVFPETALLGICSRNNLTFSEKFGPQKSEEVGEKTEKEEFKRDINKRYEYFIFLEDSTEMKKGVSTETKKGVSTETKKGVSTETIKGVAHFLLNFASHLTKPKENTTDQNNRKPETPVIALLLQGKMAQIDLILAYLKLGLPLVIFEGSGGLADIIAFAYHQYNYHPRGISLAEYTEAVLKPQITDRMLAQYPELLEYEISSLTEKVFDCLRYSKHRGQEFITVLSHILEVNFPPSSIPSYLLKALFKSQTSEAVKSIKQLKKDLFLAMDWNSADVAREEVFVKDTNRKLCIDEDMFFRALTSPQREDFITLFLNRGFVIHRYLDTISLLDLFQDSLKREFFRSVVWENVLGLGTTTDLSRNFLDNELIILIEKLTGIPSLVYSWELDWNYRTIYEDRTPEEAERKAIAILAMWAILSYRVELVKTIWRQSEQPIHIALACSIILKKLVPYVSDFSMKYEMDEQANEFSVMAIDIMTICWDNVPCRAIDLLHEKNRVWSYKILMELAAFAKNKRFLAHPCCQKYLYNMFMGHIKKIRALPYGDLTIPLWLKITLSAFFIFPIFMWVKFDALENESSDDTLKSAFFSSDHNFKNEPEISSRSKWKKSTIIFLYKIYYYWAASITKFWVFHIFYALFVMFFSLAVIWPACGNLFLDFFTCVWIATIIIDEIYHAYILNIKYTSMTLAYKYLEISLMILLLFCYAMGRIILKDMFMSPYEAKAMLCIALLYFYYHLMITSLPISSELGPMLYKVKRLVCEDFVNFMSVSILVIISNGIVMHATLYPDYPLNSEFLHDTFTTALVSFFLAPNDIFGDPDPKCIKLKRHENKMSFVGLSPDECKVGRYLRYQCPNTGVWPHLFGIQYLTILRLIFVVVLFAIFSSTVRTLEEEGMYIWKYQRYELVINFSNRLTLPPPFSVITIFYMLFKYLFYCFCSYLNKYILKYCKFKSFKRKIKYSQHETLDEDDFRYWKSLAIQYHKDKNQEKSEEVTTRKRMERVNDLADALNNQRRALRDLKGHLNELSLLIKKTYQRLEDSGLQVSVLEMLRTKNIAQIYSRTSPYPNTIILRYPVSDNHVPWKNTWTSYDPISFTRSKEDFPLTLQPYVDIDIRKKCEVEGEAFIMPHYNWNSMTMNVSDIYVDRTSWISDKENRAFKYKLDSKNLPKNPLGRTGLKGRGYLPRWGPNHYIYVVITQWHEKEVIFHKYLDVILMFRVDKFSLPGGFVYTENRYEILQSLFDTEAKWKDSDDMIAFFDSLKEEKSSKSLCQMCPEDTDTREFVFDKVKLGYMDEETNTDQAWCEAEVWHFHYGLQSYVKEKFREEVEWYLLSEENLVKVPIGQAAIMHSVAKKMKAILEII